MMTDMWKKLNYISWKTEAKRILLSNDEMKAKLQEVMSSRSIAASNTKVADFINEDTYKTEIFGDYVELYMRENGNYVIYCNNLRDSTKNTTDKPFRADKIFQAKFKELTGVGLQAAFGYVDKTLKRCIPKQLDYINKKYCNETLLMSSIDASSQYASGCLGLLPDAHTAVYVEHYAEPTAEYPFAFYASGHLAIYNELDTHKWVDNPLFPNLFRLKKKDDWPFRHLSRDQEHTILMKASLYNMNDTWRYFYNIKQSYPKDSKEYGEAKLVMNQVIGQWHRKDKDKKRAFTYDDNGSFKLAHIVAVAIARGNQKILNKVEELDLSSVAHICVDGIIYIGNKVFGQPEVDLGVFCQEFTGVPTVIRDINVYMAKDKNNYKFRHAGYDLINGEDIDDKKEYDFTDLYNLSQKERIGDMIKKWEDQKAEKTKE